MPAFIHAEMGEDCEAFMVIDRIMKENESKVREIKPEEMDFMRYFIKYRLKTLRQKNFNPTKCKNIK
jgi:hypothetical protein